MSLQTKMDKMELKSIEAMAAHFHTFILEQVPTLKLFSPGVVFCVGPGARSSGGARASVAAADRGAWAGPCHPLGGHRTPLLGGDVRISPSAQSLCPPTTGLPHRWPPWSPGAPHPASGHCMQPAWEGPHRSQPPRGTPVPGPPRAAPRLTLNWVPPVWR